MGLLSRLGRGLTNIGHDASIAGADTVLAATGGGLIGGLSSINNPNNVGHNMLAGGALGGALGAGFGIRRVVMALAQEMKRMHPNVPDEQILQAAEQAAQQMGKEG